MRRTLGNYSSRFKKDKKEKVIAMVSFTKGTFKEIVSRRLLKENEKLNKIAEANIQKAKQSKCVDELEKVAVKITELRKATTEAEKQFKIIQEKAQKEYPMTYFVKKDDKDKIVVEKVRADLVYEENSWNNLFVSTRGNCSCEYLNTAMRDVSYDVSQFKLVMEVYGKDEIAKAIKDFIAGKKVEL
jgi:ClpP class serine protease